MMVWGCSGALTTGHMSTCLLCCHHWAMCLLRVPEKALLATTQCASQPLPQEKVTQGQARPPTQKSSEDGQTEYKA